MHTNLIQRRRSARKPRVHTAPNVRVFNPAGFITLGAFWQTAGRIRASPALPLPGAVLQTALNLIQDRAFHQHIAASLTIVLTGIGLAAAVGFTTGILIFRYGRLKAALLPVIESVRGVAALTLFPLLIITLGIGTVSRVFVIFWTAWPAIVLSTIASLEIDRGIVDAARAAGAGDWTIIARIRIPMALEGLVTGLRIGAGGGWISLIAAEMLGASRGLGYYLLWSSQSFEFRKVYAVILIIAAIGGLMNLCLLFLQKKAYLITGETR